jgi:hypothetical protein
MKRVLTIAIGAVLASGLTASWNVPIDWPTVSANKYIRAHGGIPPCTHEDGSGQPKPCYWNAQVQGNGEGRSYVIVPDGGDGRIVYLTPRIVDRCVESPLGYCEGPEHETPEEDS